METANCIMEVRKNLEFINNTRTTYENHTPHFEPINQIQSSTIQNIDIKINSQPVRNNIELYCAKYSRLLYF